MSGDPSATSFDEQTPHAALPREVSVGRIVKLALPLAVVILAGAWILFADLQTKAQQKLEDRQLDQLLNSETASPSSTIEFVDADQNLLADFPPNELCIKPEKIVFSYIPSDDPGDEAKTWQPLIDALAEQTGLPAEITFLKNVNDQIAALADGELHVTAVNTGAVSQAVRLGGFIPASTIGHDGSYGYTMKVLVAANSDIKEVGDLKGRKITFVRPNSNSGFKAALVLLMKEYNLLPERDYEFVFSMGHDNSVRDLIAGKTDAVPVASDLLERMVAAGDVDADAVRSTYESERFPPVALGYSYQLDSGLRDKIAKVLVEFDWTDTELAKAYEASGVTEFVPVNYKNDWANIRRIDDAMEQARQR